MYSHQDSYSDMEYDQYEPEGDSRSTPLILPEQIKQFLMAFQRAICSGNLPEIAMYYEQELPSLSERYFKTSQWPDWSVVAPVVSNDELFLILYRELAFRHLYATFDSKKGPPLSPIHRTESYNNYCRLFNFLLDTDKPVRLSLPPQWLWDMIDEFLYQFQSCCLWRAKATDTQLDSVWNVVHVMNALHALIEKGMPKQGVPDEFSRHPLYQMLAAFSLSGLLRLHTQLGDYSAAVKCAEQLGPVRRHHLFQSVPTALASMHYHLGFSLMMTRRYADAARTFSEALLFLSRAQAIMGGNGLRTFQQEAMQKQRDQMVLLLGVSLALFPQRIDDAVFSLVQEKLQDKQDRQSKLQKGDKQEMGNIFNTCAPKFLQPSGSEAGPMSLRDQQQRVFLEEVDSLAAMATVRSYLKLYTTLPLRKLAQFMDMGEEELKTLLLRYKLKMLTAQSSDEEDVLGLGSTAGPELDFFIEEEMIHVADTKVGRHFGHIFIRNIHKFEEIYRNLKMASL